MYYITQLFIKLATYPELYQDARSAKHKNAAWNFAGINVPEILQALMCLNVTKNQYADIRYIERI